MTPPHHIHRLSSVQAVLFDAYGTLIEIAAKCGPFRQLLHIGAQQGRPVTPSDAVTLMTVPLGLRDAAERLGIQLTTEQAAQLDADLRTEIASIRLFPETLATLQQLKLRGYRLGLCSNLAADYAAPITALLASHLDVYVWSFDAGAIKPDPQIYAHSCRALACRPDQILMVGDTYAADVAGPRAYGMQALQLDRTGRSPRNDVLRTLAELLPLLDAACVSSAT